jgi:hypothetical protein
MVMVAVLFGREPRFNRGSDIRVFRDDWLQQRKGLVPKEGIWAVFLELLAQPLRDARVMAM